MEKEKPKKPHLSASALRMYEDCGEQYRRRYIEHEKIPPGIAMIRGSSVDDSVSFNLQSLIDSGEMVPKELALTTAEEAITNRLNNQEVLYSDEEVAEGIKNVKGRTVDSVIGLSGLHYDKAAPDINPIAVQKKWTLELDNFPFNILGYLDIEELKNIIDTKVSGKSPNGNAADISEQLTLYALAIYAEKNFIPTVRLDYLVETPKNKTRSYKPLESTRTMNDFRTIVNRLETMASGIEKEVFMPCSSDHWKCNPKWCGYYSTCRYARR
jgi:hypothetical protein